MCDNPEIIRGAFSIQHCSRLNQASQMEMAGGYWTQIRSFKQVWRPEMVTGSAWVIAAKAMRRIRFPERKRREMNF